MNHPSLGILQHPPSTPGVEDLGVALEQHRDTPLRLRNDNAIDEIDGIDNAIDDIDDAIDDIDDGDHGTLPWTSTNHVADVSNTTTTDTNNNMTTPAASPGDTTVSIQDSSSSFSSSSSSKESKDQDEPETTEYQLQKATAWDNKIAIGNVVYAPWPNHNNNNNSNNNSNKKSKYYWGTILARRSKGHYNIEFSDKKISNNVGIQQMFTLESSQYKDSRLAVGNVVYAAWPGTDLDKDFFYWGRISEIFSYKTCSNKCNIHFFPDSHGIVDTTHKLDSENLHRQEEALYLMQQEQLDTQILPTNLESLEKLLEMQELPQHQRPRQGNKTKTTTKKKKIVTSKKRFGLTTTTSSSSHAKTKKAATKRHKPSQSRKSDGYQLASSEASRIHKGDLVYAPWPNKDPLKESWFWGTVGKTRNRDKDTYVVDVHFEDGDVSNNVWDQYLYKLESQAYKDSVLQVGDVAYAPFPGKNPKLESYYWGRISGISTKSPGGHPSYCIDFPDGDQTEQVSSVHFHQYKECMYLMSKGWMAKDEPPPTLLRRR